MDRPSFLGQLEQRSLQVKNAIASLDAERQRIESLIRELLTLVPHYEALLAAERAIADAYGADAITTPQPTPWAAGEPPIPTYLARTIDTLYATPSTASSRTEAAAEVRVADEPPATPAPPSNAAPRPTQPLPGDTVYMADGTALKVIDTSDPALLTVEHPGGQHIKIGRRGVLLEPPVAASPTGAEH